MEVKPTLSCRMTHTNHLPKRVKHMRFQETNEIHTIQKQYKREEFLMTHYSLQWYRHIYIDRYDYTRHLLVKVRWWTWCSNINLSRLNFLSRNNAYYNPPRFTFDMFVCFNIYPLGPFFCLESIFLYYFYFCCSSSRQCLLYTFVLVLILNCPSFLDMGPSTSYQWWSFMPLFVALRDYRWGWSHVVFYQPLYCVYMLS